jgi:hypothetical protein
MSADAIDRVEMMAIQNMNNNGLMFTNRNQNIIDDHNDINEDEKKLDCAKIYPEFTVTGSDDRRKVEYYLYHESNDHSINLEDGDCHFEILQDVIANRAEITGVQDSLSKHNNKYEDYSPDEVDRIIINHYIEKISDLDMEDQDEPDEVANVMGVRYDLCTCYYSLS